MPRTKKIASKKPIIQNLTAHELLSSISIATRLVSSLTKAATELESGDPAEARDSVRSAAQLVGVLAEVVDQIDAYCLRRLGRDLAIVNGLCIQLFTPADFAGEDDERSLIANFIGDERWDRFGFESNYAVADYLRKQRVVTKAEIEAESGGVYITCRPRRVAGIVARLNGTVKSLAADLSPPTISMAGGKES